MPPWRKRQREGEKERGEEGKGCEGVVVGAEGGRNGEENEEDLWL